ncbi:MAG: hypothetical protein JSW58_04975 [Candidatus Latescibacterota bacterium]|nr:MAG: hypothetical protein JSW58_04975 [Candidatus Latescibacterota bacterium]
MKVKVKLTHERKKKAESAEIIPSVGAFLQLDFEDARTKWSLDYERPDSVVLTIDGRVKLIDTKGITLTAGSGMTRDFFEKTMVLEGMLEMEFGKDLKMKIKGSSGPDGNYVGARLDIEF